MIYFNNKNFFNLKIKMLLVHGLLFGLVIFFFSCVVLKKGFVSTKGAVCATIFFLTLEQLFNNFLFRKKLDINNDDEFLKYKYCKVFCDCKCSIDSLLTTSFKNTPDIVTFKDTKLRYTSGLGAISSLFENKNLNDIVGKTPADIFPEPQSKIIMQSHRKLLRDKTSQTFSVSFVRPSGNEIIYEFISSPIFNNEKLMGIITIGRDITETFCCRDALAFSNSKLKFLINNSPMMAYILDTEGKFILGNDRAKGFLLAGTDSTSDGRRIIFDIEAIMPELLEEDKQVIKTGKEIELEKRLPAKNGERYWYKICKAPIRDKAGNICAVSTFQRNIEKEKRIDEQRETYIATLTHDLKTPTIAQIRALELLLSEQLGSFNSEQKEMLKLTLDSCKYMYDMVYTLLSTYKFENGEVILTCSQFNLTDIILECIYELSHLAKENSVKLEFGSKVKECLITADKIEMKRVIINLLSNAINYAYSSSIVQISLQIKGKKAEVKVKNSGPYIEPEVLSGLFRKYVTHSEKYNKVGIGLGLYLSKKIIDAHCGKIIAESSKNQHNTFGFIIPVTTPAAICTTVS